jgi:hypothetical protein
VRRAPLDRAGEEDRTEVAAKQVRAGVHTEQAVRVADRGDVQLVAVVIDLHEHDADVPRELGLADDPDDANAAQGHTPPRKPGVQRGPQVGQARIRGAGERVDAIRTEEEDGRVMADEHQTATLAVLQHQAERTIAGSVVERPLLKPPWAAGRLGPAREPEEDELAGVLLDLATRPLRDRAGLRGRQAPDHHPALTARAQPEGALGDVATVAGAVVERAPVPVRLGRPSGSAGE